ncbi:nucleotide exchange factor GrpE [Halorhabdus rudnickae]|uniref:nucleotide exchange factor GrpE n=1 Tax=Halorhabdus rudnickae TaxID=1775544 RepID=UPI001082C54D|nr:nucleotide exchange factor GrpE [Halorhabdus rudnickae]
MTETEQDDGSVERTDEGATDADGASDGSAETPESDSESVASLREELLEEVQETDDAELADEIAARELEIETLRAEIDELEETVAEHEAEIEDLNSRLKRKQADFQNYKKRMERKREEEKRRATEDLVERLLDVRDNLQRALEQDDPADLRDGVESTFRQFERELDRENVAPIEPEPGDEVDPEGHEVLAQIEADYPEGTIADVHRPGYEMGEKVLRPAQVAVSDGSNDENETDS